MNSIAMVVQPQAGRYVTQAATVRRCPGFVDLNVMTACQNRHTVVGSQNLLQLREAPPEGAPYRYVILDRDSKFDDDVINSLQATGLRPKRTSVQAPWQNGLAEGRVGSRRREILENVITLNGRYLRRVTRDHMNPQRDDRIHDSLEKDRPNGRPEEKKPAPQAASNGRRRPTRRLALAGR